MRIDEIIERSNRIRERYHQLELKHHGSKWTVGEDALAFVTDAGLVGRLTMSHQERWPKGGNEKEELSHKLGESVWWLTVLSTRMRIDFTKSIGDFLEESIHDMQQLKRLSLELRESYQQAELEFHGSEWTVEEDALAFLTDIALVVRMVMAQQKRWPLHDYEQIELEHKLGESVWWLTVLAHRMNLDIEVALENFLAKTEKLLLKKSE